MTRFFRYKVLLILLAPVLAFSQADSSFKFIKNINGDIVDFAVDNMNNLYLFNSTDQLKKLDVNGDSVAVFNNVRKLGRASYLDVSNPLRILLYYKNFTTVVVLDRFLNVRTTIDLRKQNIFQVHAVCLSYDNNIWLYDEVENKLKKIDETGKLLMETSDFRQLFGESATPVRIFDQDGFVYLYDTARGVYVFDYYGVLKNKIAISGWDNLKVVGKSVFGTTGDTLHSYQMELLRVLDYKIPNVTGETRKIDFTNTRFYILKQNEVGIYQLK